MNSILVEVPFMGILLTLLSDVVYVVPARAISAYQRVQRTPRLASWATKKIWDHDNRYRREIEAGIKEEEDAIKRRRLLQAERKQYK